MAWNSLSVSLVQVINARRVVGQAGYPDTSITEIQWMFCHCLFTDRLAASELSWWSSEAAMLKPPEFRDQFSTSRGRSNSLMVKANLESEVVVRGVHPGIKKCLLMLNIFDIAIGKALAHPTEAHSYFRSNFCHTWFSLYRFCLYYTWHLHTQRSARSLVDSSSSADAHDWSSGKCTCVSLTCTKL